MQKALLIFSLMSLVFEAHSQIDFENGYLVDSTGRKVECLIRNNDWYYNPTSFKYKLSENSELKTGAVESMQEFGIYNQFKYISRLVKIDRSSNELKDLSSVRKPEFEEERLFLKVLVEGKATLFSYREGKLIRYFYNVEGAEIKQLIFKTYKTSHNRTAENNTFRQQLWNDLKCPAFSPDDFKDLKYYERDLINIFTAYSKCHDVAVVNLQTREKGKTRDWLNLSLRPGIRYSSLAIENEIMFMRPADYGSKVGWRLGLEAAFILPFNKNKWAVVIEPTYQYFKTNLFISAPNLQEGGYISSINYESIAVPLSLRYYFFLNDKSKVFVNGTYCLDFAFNSFWEARRIGGDMLHDPTPLSTSKPVFGFGAGYKYADKYSLEFRYQQSRDLFSKDIVWNSEYDQISIILGYTIF